MRRISSRLTFWYKRVFPIIWFGLLAVFVDGKKFRTLRGPTIAADFKALVIDYIDQRYGKPTAAE